MTLVTVTPAAYMMLLAVCVKAFPAVSGSVKGQIARLAAGAGTALFAYMYHMAARKLKGEKKYTNIRGTSMSFWHHICSASADASAPACNAWSSDKSSRAALHHIRRPFVYCRRVDVYVRDGDRTKRQKKIAEKASTICDKIFLYYKIAKRRKKDG